MGALEDWYCDGVKAQTYDSSPGAHDPGHAILRLQPYPGPPWRKLWQETNELGQAAIIHALRDELYGLSHGPSQAAPAVSGLHPGTAEWKHTVATAEGSLREVARRFGTSHTTVRGLRMEHA